VERLAAAVRVVDLDAASPVPASEADAGEVEHDERAVAHAGGTPRLLFAQTTLADAWVAAGSQAWVAGWVFAVVFLAFGLHGPRIGAPGRRA
jgi:hypothetical protein